MKRRLSILIALFAVLVPAAGRGAVPPSDPKAVHVAEQVMTALGGRARWDALPGLAWTFTVTSHDSVRAPARSHAWNKHTRQHRVEGTMRDGAKFVIVHVLGDSTRGAAWVNGTAIHGDSLRKLVRRAEALWVNDSYWFLMPYKLLDPGVRLRYDRLVREKSGTYDRLALSFDHVGLTPGDRYWVDVDHTTHRVVRWEMVLEGSTPPPVDGPSP